MGKRLTAFSVNDGNFIVAYFFDKTLASNYVRQAKKDCMYNDLAIVEKVVDIDLLNEQAERIKLLEDDILAQTMTINNLEGVLKVAQKENEQLKERNEKLIKKLDRLEQYIETIFNNEDFVCKHIDIEDVQFYCERNRDYCFPTCTYKKCYDEKIMFRLVDKIREVTE